MRGLLPRTFAARAAVFFAAATLGMYWPVLAGRTPLPVDFLLMFPPWRALFDGTVDRMATLGDLITQFYPYRAFSGAHFREGRIPLWNPHVFAGAPYQANPLSAIFAPATLLHALLPSPLAWGVGFMLRAFVSAFFTGLLLKELKASASGAIAGGIAYGFAGFMLSWQGWPQADSACWLPLVCLAVVRLRRAPTPGHVAVAAIAFVLPLLGGHPGVALYVIAYALAFAAYCSVAIPGDEPVAARGRFVLAVAASGALAAGVAAIQLLPTLEWIGQTNRSPADVQIGQWHRPPAEIVSFLVRDAGNDPNFAGVNVPEALTYSGVITVVAAFLAPLFSRPRHAAFFALLLLLCLQVVYGWGPMFWVTSHTPGIAAFNNWRVIVGACFSLAMLAGLGITGVQERVRRGGPARWWWLLVSVAGAACAAGIWVLRRKQLALLPVFVPEVRAAVLSAAALVALGTLLLSPPVARRLGARVVGAAAVAILCVDVFTFAYGHVPFARTAEVFPEPPVFAWLKRHDRGVYRIISVDSTVSKNVESMPFGLYSPTGYDYVLRRALNVIRPLTVNALNPDFVPATIVADRSRLLDLLNVKYLIANGYHPGGSLLAACPDRFRQVFDDGLVRVFENLRVLPRAIVVPRAGVEVEADDVRALARVGMSSFDPAASVVVDEAPAWPASDGRGSSGEDRADFVSLGPNEVRIAARTSGDAVLVFTDIHYPGWRVWVDGREAPLLRTDYAFKGVALAAGEHEVRFAFRPWRTQVGALVSAASLLLAAALVAADRRRHQPLGDPGSTPEGQPRPE